MAQQFYRISPITDLSTDAINLLIRELNTRFDDLQRFFDVPTFNMKNLNGVATATTGNQAPNLAQTSTVDTDQTITGLKTFDRGTNAPFAIENAAAAKVTNLDSDKLDGLDSTAFAILNGQAGGQTLTGGTAASEDLTLRSTSHATKGTVFIQDELKHTGTTGLGFFNHATATQQTVDANTNSVTVGGSAGVIADFTDLVIYANDAATIRNDVYQLARSVKQITDALRAYGLGA